MKLERDEHGKFKGAAHYLMIAFIVLGVTGLFIIEAFTHTLSSAAQHEHAPGTADHHH